jgi:hypothetical protein
MPEKDQSSSGGNTPPPQPQKPAIPIGPSNQDVRGNYTVIRDVPPPGPLEKK